MRFRSAGEEDLARLLEARLPELDLAEVRAVLRNPFLSASWIERLLEVPRLASAYEVRKAVAGHPHTPHSLALRLVPGLYWADLVRVGTETRLHPLVRRAADRRLVERLPGLAVGERMAIGRSASPAVLTTLRFDSNPRVIAAVLDNPRLTEGSLVALAAHERASPQVLSVLCRNGRWAVRRTIRVALCRNPATPDALVLGLLPGLDKGSLATVASDTRLSRAVRRKAGLLAGGGPRGKAGPFRV